MSDLRTDEELVVAIHAGDLRAFDALYQRWAARLYGYMLRILGDAAQTEDLLQEVMLTVLSERTTSPRPGRFGGWLFTVARNRCLSQLRQAKSHQAKLESLQPPSAANSEPAALRDLLVREALQSLTEPHREALLLKEVGQLSYREIAEVQDVPEGTAKSRLHFAIAALRRAFSA